MVDHACDHCSFLCLNDRYRLIWVEAQEVLAKITLVEVEVREGGVGFLQLVVHPIDSSIPVFNASAGLRVVLHDLPGADFSIDINLPEYYFPVSRGSQQVVVGCLRNLQIREMFAEEPDEVGVVGEGAFQVFVGNIVGSFWLGALRCMKE